MKKVAIVANLDKKKVPPVMKRLILNMKKRNISVLLLKDSAEYINRKDLSADEEQMRKNAQVLISLGGDGTLLKAARIVRGENIPILGVNMGGLGFLTEITYRELDEVLPLLFRKRYSIEKRSMLAVSVSRNAQNPEPEQARFRARLFALNDVVLSRGASSRVIELKTFIDGEYLTTFASDGLIVSTSTGSTAHSLSSGGPIIHPSIDSLLIVPICPHTLSNRPILVPNQSKIRVKTLTRHPVEYTVDGQVGGKLNKDDEIEVSLAPFHISLVRLRGTCPTKFGRRENFYELLRKKLKWSGYSVGK